MATTDTLSTEVGTTIQTCPGRLRVKLPALYRSAIEKQRIEGAWTAHAHVISVLANPLTGNVLVLFDLAVSPQRMMRVLGIVPLPEGAAPAVPTAPAARTRRAPAAAPPAQLYPAWHARSAVETLEYYASSAHAGLSAHAVEQRLQQGLNLLPQERPRSSLEILLGQFQSVPVALLGVSAALSLLTGGLAEALAIGAVLALNGGIGYTTEKRAEATIASLSELIDDIVPVLRDGDVQATPASHVVPGDILVLVPGVRIAADARLLQAQGLTVDESALTGESRFVAKTEQAQALAAPLAERISMAYMGTAVTGGTGLAVVVGTGAHTEIGAIQALMTQTETPRTPIQIELDRLGTRLVTISSGICAAVFVIGLLRGQGLLPMLKSAISLAIAAVPEGLPTVATTSLARGIRRLRAHQMLVRRLQAVETLGDIHTICLDKTGTLTENRMAVVALRAGARSYELGADGRLDARAMQDNPALAQLLRVCALCYENGAGPGNGDGNGNGNGNGSPINASATESALTALANDSGMPVDTVRERHARIATELRAEGRNYMTTIHRLPDSDLELVAVKGSPREVLALCDRMQDGERLVALDDSLREDIIRQNHEFAGRRLRVLGFAWGRQRHGDSTARGRLIWIGLAGLADPLRAGAERFIADMHAAGIRTVMVTGDQRSTARAIGESLALADERPLRVVDATFLERCGPTAADADVFARISPQHKLKIVQALQASGETVAMTGDGINDGPALRAANVGIAMGLHGTDLARSAADVVLKDDRLETVLEAIREGRTITRNIEKSIHFLISSNLSEIFVMLGAVGTVGGAPLSPMQLLWINLLTDVLPAVALAAEPADRDVMRHTPRKKGQPLIDNGKLADYAIEGGLLAGGTLAAYLYGATRYGIGPRAGALAFNSLVTGQLLHALTCRSQSGGLAAFGRGGNPQLIWAIGGSLCMQVLANLVPGLRKLLGTGALSPSDLAATIAGAGIPLLVNTARKRRLDKGGAMPPSMAGGAGLTSPL